MKRLQDYKLPREREPFIDDLIFDKLGREVLAIHNKRFKDNPNIADLTEYEENQPITYSNVPRALSYSQIVRELTNGRLKLLTPEDVVRYWDSIPERSTTYSDTEVLAAFPNEGPNEDLKRRVLEIAGIKELEVPYLISGLGAEPAGNQHGFTFTEIGYVIAREAPFLKKDQRVSYDPEKGLIPSKDGIRIWTPSNQSGLRRASRDRDDGLGFRGGWLLDSYSDGRVQLISAEGAEKN